MKNQFKVSYYLRSNYENKEGKSPIMMRVNINGGMVNLGSTRLAVKKTLWSNQTSRAKGRTAEAIEVNASLDSLSAAAQELFRKCEFQEDLTAESFKAKFLGYDKEFSSIIPIFEKYNEGISQQVGKSMVKATYQKYDLVTRQFGDFLSAEYHKSDLAIIEFTPSVVEDFELYLKSKLNIAHNTAQKKLKLLKTMTIYAQKRGYILHDPFLDIHFHAKPVDRGFLSEEELAIMADKDLSHIKRLEVVRDIFLFSCFTGLAYIDVANLKPDNIVTMDDKQWIVTNRQKTKVPSNVLLLDVPKQIISKYNHETYREGKLFPILSNQKMNSYLKEIADICNIRKNLTFHLARHTFATLCLTKGVPMESVSKMLGHTNIRTTQIYGRITSKKIEKDMMELADKIGNFSLNNVPPLETVKR